MRDFSLEQFSLLMKIRHNFNI